MMGCGVLIAAAKPPGFALGVADEIFWIAKRNAVLFGKSFRAACDQHHVRTVLEDGARETDGIADVLQRGNGAGAERASVHDDSVAFDAAIQIKMRAKTGVEDGIVFKNEDGGFDGVERGTAVRKNGPARGESAAATGIAGVDSFIGNVPGAAVNDEGRFHPEENGKGKSDCPERGGASVFNR